MEAGLQRAEAALGSGRADAGGVRLALTGFGRGSACQRGTPATLEPMNLASHTNWTENWGLAMRDIGG